MRMLQLDKTAQSPVQPNGHHRAALNGPEGAAKPRFDIHTLMAPVAASGSLESAIPFRILSDHKPSLLKRRDDGLPVPIYQLLADEEAPCPQPKGREP